MRPVSDHISADYRVRLLASVVASLLVVLGIIRLWPPPQEAAQRLTYQSLEREAIQVEEILPTRQIDAVPRPPTPPIPVVVPDDHVLEEPDLDFTDNLLAVEEPGEEAVAGKDDSDESSRTAGPTVGPKTVRFVEPEYTREARERRIRAELVVRVLVDDRGHVEEATIVERFLVGNDGISRTPVETLGYGLEDAALSAADRWMFRPARKDGKPVASHTVLTFTFGVDA